MLGNGKPKVGGCGWLCGHPTTMSTNNLAAGKLGRALESQLVAFARPRLARSNGLVTIAMTSPTKVCTPRAGLGGGFSGSFAEWSGMWVIRLSFSMEAHSMPMISIQKARRCRRKDAVNRPVLDRGLAGAPNSPAA